MDAMWVIVLQLGHDALAEAQSLTHFLVEMTVDGNGVPKRKPTRRLPIRPRPMAKIKANTNTQSNAGMPGSLDFMHLPLEMKQKIFSTLFGPVRKELGFDTSLTFGGAEFSCRSCSWDISVACSRHRHGLRICVPQHLEQLYVSAQWYAEALPVFVSHTMVDTAYFTLLRALKVASKLPLLKSILQKIFTNTNTIQLPVSALTNMNIASENTVWASRNLRKFDVS